MYTELKTLQRQFIYYLSISYLIYLMDFGKCVLIYSIYGIYDDLRMRVNYHASEWLQECAYIT